jgi:uncharacterized protein (TIGR00251 family)
MLSKLKKQLKEKGEIYLRVKARPGAGKTNIKGILDDDTVKIDIAASPAKDRANQELIGFLAGEFEVFKKNVKIISGLSEKLKLVKITK